MRLEADGVVVVRGGKRILDAVSVRFSEPGLVAVIGPNGAGKSTMLSALAGLIAPDAGAVSLDGTPLARLPPRTLAQRRAYLPQNARCEWPISVESVVALGLTPYAAPLGKMAATDRARLSAMLAASDLADKSAQSVATLSGGELARAMLARALVGDPDILIADEPVAGLDPRHAIDAMQRLRDMADRGRLVIVALHDLALAARYADRIVAMREGRVLADGPAAEVCTPGTLKDLFDVTAHVSTDGDGLSIRFTHPS